MDGRCVRADRRVEEGEALSLPRIQAASWPWPGQRPGHPRPSTTPDSDPTPPVAMDVPGQGRPRWAPPAAAFVACPCPTLGGAVRCPVGGGGSGHPPRVGGGGRRLLPLPSRRAPRPPPPTASLFSWPGLGPPAWRDADAVPSMAPAAAQVATGAAAAAALRWRRPPPVVATRPPLSADLAVGLMRAAYEVLDGMDVVGMDDFQRTFWLLRSDEWARYRAENVGVTQGVLADVRYFDFISTCQFAAITGVRCLLVVVGQKSGGWGVGGWRWSFKRVRWRAAGDSECGVCLGAETLGGGHDFGDGTAGVRQRTSLSVTAGLAVSDALACRRRGPAWLWVFRGVPRLSFLCALAWGGMGCGARTHAPANLSPGASTRSSLRPPRRGW